MRGIGSIRAAWWAQQAGRRVRKDLAAAGLDQLTVLPPPPLPSGCRRRVVAVLGLRKDSCLVRAAVLQQWDLGQGRPRDLIIGVTAPGPGFRAHAWLEGDPPAATDGLDEFTRRPPRPALDVSPLSGAGRSQALQQEGKVGPGS